MLLPVSRIMGTERVTRQQNRDTGGAARSRRKRDSSIEMQVSGRYRQSSALHRAPVPRTIIFSPMRYRRFSSLTVFPWRPLTFRLPTSRAPAATLGRGGGFCYLSRHRYIHKAAQRSLFLSFFHPFFHSVSLSIFVAHLLARSFFLSALSPKHFPARGSNKGSGINKESK